MDPWPEELEGAESYRFGNTNSGSFNWMDFQIDCSTHLNLICFGSANEVKSIRNAAPCPPRRRFTCKPRWLRRWVCWYPLSLGVCDNAKSIPLADREGRGCIPRADQPRSDLYSKLLSSIPRSIGNSEYYLVSTKENLKQIVPVSSRATHGSIRQISVKSNHVSYHFGGHHPILLPRTTRNSVTLKKCASYELCWLYTHSWHAWELNWGRKKMTNPMSFSWEGSSARFYPSPIMQKKSYSNNNSRPTLKDNISSRFWEVS